MKIIENIIKIKVGNHQNVESDCVCKVNGIILTIYYKFKKYYS